MHTVLRYLIVIIFIGFLEDANIALKSRSTSLGTLCDDNTDL